MAPKINTSSSSKSKSGQLGRYEQLKIAHVRIQAARQAKQAKEDKEPCLTRQAHPTRQATTVWSETESDSDTTLSSRATVTAEKHARKPMRGHQRTSFIWQHMTQKELNGRKKDYM